MPALAEELVARGLDLWLEMEDEDERDEALELLMRWLGGEQLTERADEHELRLNAAEDALELFGDNVPALHRFHALAVLALPAGHERRDADEAIAELWEHLEATRDDPEETIRTIAALLDAGAGDEALLDEGDELTEEADPAGIGVFRLAAESYTAGRHVEARDAGDEAEAARWQERHGAYLDADEGEGLAALAGRAGQRDMAGDWPEAADLYRAVVEGSDLAEWDVQQMALREGELRLLLEQLDRAAAALEAVLVHAEARYLSAVAVDDVTDAGTRLHRIADALAATQARRGDWDGALRALDRPRGLRGRYQAALRADAAGRELLALERELDAAVRAATADEELDGVSAAARMLERYRQVRPRLDPAHLETPSVADVAAALDDGEGLCILGNHFTGTVGVFVAARDTRRPSGRLLLEEFGTREWLELFAGDSGAEWLQMLIEPGSGADPEPSLTDLLEDVDDVVGGWLREQLDDEGATRLTLVPGAMLHLVPWAALPSLEGIDVVIAASVSEVVRARCARREAAPRSALVVANPTLDLRVSAAACRPIAHRLGAGGYAVAELATAGATEPALLAAAPGATILHFAGHGRAELSHSGLEVHPGEALDGDPFEAWIEDAVDWREPPSAVEEDEEPPWHDAVADVPGVGRLHERRWTRVNRLDRVLERPGGTLVATYGGDRLLRLAELWSASDILLADPLEGCRLAVLVACASGAGIGRFDEAQAGLPVGLQLAGIDSVIATRWEVDEGFAALWAERFYTGLAQAGGTADLAALVRATSEELRDMDAGEARERLLALADAAGDPFAAMALEAYAHRLPDPPFAEPSQWAAFFLTGRPTLELAA
jgi:CHAT domain-containing protein